MNFMTEFGSKNMFTPVPCAYFQALSVASHGHFSDKVTLNGLGSSNYVSVFYTFYGIYKNKEM